MTLNKKQKNIDKIYDRENTFALINNFVQIVKENDLTKTKKQVSLLSSDALTKIRELEQEFGVSLMRNEAEISSLTDEGVLFYNTVYDIFESLDNIIFNLHKDLVEYENTIKIACHPLIAILVIPNLIQEMLKKHPEIRFIVREIPYNRSIEELKNGIVDIIIHPREKKEIQKQKDMDCYMLWKYHAMIFCGPENKIAKLKEEEITLDDVILSDKFVGASDVGYASFEVEKTLEKIKKQGSARVSFYNLLKTTKIIQGVTMTDKRILKVSDTKDYNLIIKDASQIIFDINFYAITKKKCSKVFLSECIKKIMEICNKIDDI